MMIRSGSAVWNGSLKDGKGSISTETQTLNNVGYGFQSRFGEEKATNPEELIGAAHAACFSMALSAELGKAGFNPEKIETTAHISFDKVGDGFEITKSHLVTRVSVSGVEEDQFQEIAKATSQGCPVSKLLKAEISVEATRA